VASQPHTPAIAKHVALPHVLVPFLGGGGGGGGGGLGEDELGGELGDDDGVGGGGSFEEGVLDSAGALSDESLPPVPALPPLFTFVTVGSAPPEHATRTLPKARANETKRMVVLPWEGTCVYSKVRSDPFVSAYDDILDRLDEAGRASVDPAGGSRALG
jgi:hypothetical protein